MSKVFLLTGSTRGLGRQIAEAVLADGHRLVATARRPEGLADLAERYGDQILPVALDVTDPEAARAAVAAGVAAFGRIDVVVNNAGYANLVAVEDITARGLPRADRRQPARRRQRHQGRAAGAAPPGRGPHHPGLLDRRAAGHPRPVRLPGGQVGGRRLLRGAGQGGRAARHQGHRAGAGRHADRLGRRLDAGPAGQRALPGRRSARWPGCTTAAQATALGDPAKVARVVLEVAAHGRAAAAADPRQRGLRLRHGRRQGPGRVRTPPGTT